MNSIFLVTLCLVMVLGIAGLIYSVLHASDGYEDEEGFHPLAPRKSRSRSHSKRARAVEAEIDIKAAALH